MRKVLRGVAVAAAVFLGAGLWAGLAANARSADIKVVATIKPLQSLLAQVLEGIAVPEVLIEGQASPHGYALRPSDVRALQQADVVFRVSAQLEPFTERIAQSLPETVRIVDLATAPGVELLRIRTGATFERHDHSEHDGDHEAHGDHGGSHDSNEAASGAIDGHIWLDPYNAKAIVRHAADVLAQSRPDLGPLLAANAARAIAALDALDAELRAALSSSATRRPFVVFHDAYQYFEHRYGLQAAGAITLTPEVAPSARRLSAIRRTLRESGAMCVFAEPNFSARVIAAAVEGTQAKAGTLDPLGYAVAAGPAHYGETMRTLAKSLVGCLAQ